MSEVIDWPSAPNPDDAVRAVVAALEAGRVVILPTETGYVLAASGQSAEAVASLRQLLTEATDPWSVALSSEVVARDLAPALGVIGRRLTRRLWPGPVTLAISNPPDCVPEPMRSRAAPAGTMHVRCPAHEAIREVLSLLPVSVLLADVPRLVATGPATGVQLAEALGDRVALVLNDGPSRFPEGATVVGVNGERWQVLREGAVPADLIERQTVCLVVFVCTGNTCRSPMAEALLKKRLSDRLGCSPADLPARGYVVISAGLSAYNGGPAAAEAIAEAAAYGADLTGHRSRSMTAELLFQADYVVGMTLDHVEALAGATAGLTETPRLLSPDGDDLSDPVGHARAVYTDCAAAIWKHVDALAAEILASSPSSRSNP